MFDALGLPAPALAREAYTLDEFIAELAGPGGPFRAVDVHKRRVRYTIGGCTSEVTDVTADGIPTRTIAIESKDAAAVVAAVRSMGLADYLNTRLRQGPRRAARRDAAALRRDRRRHQLHQVPRRASVPRTAPGGPSSTGPR